MNNQNNKSINYHIYYGFSSKRLTAKLVSREDVEDLLRVVKEHIVKELEYILSLKANESLVVLAAQNAVSLANLEHKDLCKMREKD